MDKYYIPELKEFYIGFEYEWLNENNEWIKETSPIEITIKDFNEQVYGLRVKYLSREDIESLGWIIDKVHEGKDQELFHKDNIVLYYRYKTKELGIFTRDPSKNEYYSVHNVDPHRIQSLVIKNKSELIKLLKQLQIG